MNKIHLAIESAVGAEYIFRHPKEYPRRGDRYRQGRASYRRDRDNYSARYRRDRTIEMARLYRISEAIYGTEITLQRIEECTKGRFPEKVAFMNLDNDKLSPESKSILRKTIPHANRFKLVLSTCKMVFNDPAAHAENCAEFDSLIDLLTE